MTQDTIFALSTVLGKSGIAVIRISGPQAFAVLADFQVKKKLEHGHFIFAKIFHPQNGNHLDDVIILGSRAPNSFTGEDTIELHLHGSVAVIKDILSALSKLSYLRFALPGEFSKIAFLNGKLDLTKAEALVNLINSETTIQKEIALRQLGGELENLYESWRLQMIGILAKLEALIDFPDEDIPQSLLGQLAHDIKQLSEKIYEHLHSASRGETITRGIKIAIIGAPNVGKSSLLNALAKRDVAIVSDIAGTTRDVIEVKMDLNGFPIILYDTAGLRDASDVIESEGIKRAINTSRASDISLYVVDSTAPESQQIVPQAHEKPYLVLKNKSDLQKGEILLANEMLLSVKTGEGLDELIKKLANMIEEIYTPSHEPMITSERYRQHLSKSFDLLKCFNLQTTLEISAEYVRLATKEIGQITGKVEVEEVLDEIFSSFCIGK